ncbi:MAG: bifunctional biotin--[acetyl-CoA-carboxylase] ligase/biotin operon repressor BirA [Pseudomonadales bacterium]
MSLEALLAVLADGQFHSGDDLGQVLGVSRTAVWKQLKKVQELGLSLDSIKGKGYCIHGGLDLLSAEAIEANLSVEAKTLIADVELVDIIDSTNTLAMSKAVSGGHKGYVCSAERQTAGRGRRGRSWASPYGSNLYFSVVWEFTSGVAALEGLSLAVGVAVVDALQKVGVSGVQLKWPNDVLHNGRKLAGVLLEMVGDAAGPCQVAVGIGLNVNMSVESAGSIDQSWVDMKSISRQDVSRSELLALLLNELMPMLAGFERQGFAAYRDCWQQLDAYAGQEVFVKLGQDVVVGRAAGVDAAGAILIETASGQRKFNGGEVSLRVVE